MSNSNDEYQTKCYWIMMLHALGDTIGFKNGDWEFNHFINNRSITLDFVNEMIYEFIALGGINGLNLHGWHISDDTLFHLAIGKALLSYEGRIDDVFIDKVKDQMKKTLAKIISDENPTDSAQRIIRYIGAQTSSSIKNFSDTHDARFDDYNPAAGGNGCAMRCCVIGMCLYGEKNRDQLAECSIVTSMLTHNNPIGYLGGYTVALFTALALEKQPIETWPFILIDKLQSDKLVSFLHTKNLDEMWDYNQYIKYWKKYVDTRFVNKKPLREKANSNPLYRMKYYHNNFFKGTGSVQLGDSGYLCPIMAYDALLDCDGKWEKLVIYGMLHSGDSDTIGAVAGGLYGAVYGQGDVPLYMLDALEKKKSLIKLAKQLGEKFS